MVAKTELTVYQGKTFSRILRWEAAPIVYKPITAIEQSAPIRLTVPSHGLPNGWRAAVSSIRGMPEINAGSPIKAKDYEKATVVDEDTIEFNNVNAVGFRAYVSGGILQYNTPVDLTGMAARMAVKDKVGGAVLATLTTENNGIILDNTAKTIQIFITATDTALFTWKKGVYDLEMVGSDGTVTLLLSGTISVDKEVTT